ncbi:MAG: choice-of-anchor J domain-containing protein, partial [Clostridia bacterium]|nr:choice-of-anchor J domain-containing protein [Clostridia bacterium]
LSGVDFDFNTPITQNITLTAVWGEGISEETSFDNGIPDGWTQSSSDGNYQWRVGVGDLYESTGTHSGDTNALITHDSYDSTAYLIMPLMDLSSTVAATIDCWYINRDWGGDIDQFGVYYRVNGGEWQEIWATGSGSAHGSWTELSIDLPSAAFVSNVEIGFKATDGYGYGVGLDDVVFEASSASAEPNNGYNLTLNDGINVNFLIDTDFYGAEDGYVEYEYIKSNTIESAERESGSIDVADLPTYNSGDVFNGDSKLTLKAAPAQIAEDYIIRVYNKAGELQNTFTVSIADYCEQLQNDPTYGELMTSLLNYGQLANEYFGYAALVEGEYVVPHTDDYKAELSDQESAALDSLAVASVLTQGAAQVSGVSYIAQLKPEFKFYFTGTSATEAVVDGGLSAVVEKTTEGATVKVTGLNASDFDKTFTVTMDGTELEYNGYAYLKAAMNSAALKDLAQGIFRYAQAADKTFN